MTSYQHSASTVRRVSLLRLVLSIIAAGAASAVVVAAFSPFSAAAAAFSPTLYAVMAGAYSFFPFLVRRALGFRWAATSVGAVAGVLSAAVSPIGLLIVVPFVGAGAAYDAVVWAISRLRRNGRDAEWVFIAAAVVSAVVLFLVSLPVFTPANRGMLLFLVPVLGGRLVGQLAASFAAGLATRTLARFGGRRWS
jgi:hypothetical protein